jgi:RNA-directed DNA polymerase
VDYEANLIKLWREINSGRYRPGRALAFIVNRPVTREIFAARFRDRVVHHLLINKLNPLFEREFIYDSYAAVAFYRVRRGRRTRHEQFGS